MAEGTYDYECMRAELLGLEKPDLETFERNKKMQEINSEEQQNEELQEIHHTDEGLQGVSGGLDELNSILSITQQKINKFKTVCGSLTSLLKLKVGGQSESSDNLPSTTGNEPIENEVQKQPLGITDAINDLNEMTEAENKSVFGKKTTTDSKLSSQIDKLDSLIYKADNAQYSMSHQNKEMKKFLQ